MSKKDHQTEVKVEDRMTRGVITITPSESCRKALLMMHSAGINHLPVVDDDRLVGILTERDILRRAPEQRRAADAASRNRLLSIVNVGGVMTYAPHTVDPTASLREAVGVMLHRRIGCLPVIQGGQLIGIFTTRDAISILASEDRPPGDGETRGGGTKKRASR